MRRFIWALASTLFAACVLAIPARADQPITENPVTEIVAFGDSLTDTGNVYHFAGNTFPPAPPYFAGRFSNGPVWIEHLAAQLEVPVPTASRTGGTNYAWGGAETSLTGVSTRGTPNIGMQIDTYLDERGTFAPDQLVVLWGGANDFLNRLETNPGVPVANLSAEIVILATAGAETIVVPNLPPLGQTPRLVGTPFEATFDARTVAFNTLLAAELDELEATLGITIIRLDTYGLFQNILKHPQSFGLTNVTNTALMTPGGAIGVGPVVANPDDYLFWDAVHPTRAAHRIIGDVHSYFPHLRGGVGHEQRF